VCRRSPTTGTRGTIKPSSPAEVRIEAGPQRRSLTNHAICHSRESGRPPCPARYRRDAIFALEPRTFTVSVAVAAVIIIAVLSYDSVRQTAATSQDLARTVEALAQVQAILSTLKDAETGQRGYLLTGRETYLEPFESATQALPLALSAARQQVADDPPQAQRLATLTVLANEKLQELTKTVELRRAGQAEAALAIVQSDHGKTLMDRIRGLGDEMQNEERGRVVDNPASGATRPPFRCGHIRRIPWCFCS